MSKCAYILLISIVTLGSCKVKWDFEVEDFEPKIVVDPAVYLSGKHDDG